MTRQAFGELKIMEDPMTRQAFGELRTMNSKTGIDTEKAWKLRLYSNRLQR